MQSTIVAQHACFGDGGLLCAMLASRLVLDALDGDDVASSTGGGLRRGPAAARRLQFISSYQRVIHWVSELAEAADEAGKRHHAAPIERGGPPAALPPPGAEPDPCSSAVLSLREAGVQAYVAVVRNVLSSKQVSIPHGGWMLIVEGILAAGI